MKVLHMINSLGVGGAEKLLASIINDLHEFENHLLILRNPISLHPEINNLATFLNLESTSFKHALFQISAVRKYIRKENFQIIHSHLYESNIIARLAAPHNVKLFNSIHAVSSLASYNKSKASLWLEKLTYKRSHHIIGVSRTVLDDFSSHVGIKGASTVLYNFIEDVFFQNAPKEEYNLKNIKLVAVGNLKYQKNYPYLIEAFKKLPKDISLDIYGEGPLREALQKEIDQHELNIRLCGLKSNLYQILPAYDLFVMSSFFEGQSVGLLEAMACGLPALLSDISVLKEVGGKKAIYFNLEDPNDFVNKIEAIRKNQYDLYSMSVYGIEFAKKHARKEQFIEKLKNLYIDSDYGAID